MNAMLLEKDFEMDQLNHVVVFTKKLEESQQKIIVPMT